uniref:Uncharacterized protein n=1 Tax=Vespula pensylvanica TaxID=30213 RepID=A0A834JCB6_VESPE|nr:hypothetical protein H0235_018478 [Vespula pensylvanica]
MDLEISVPSGYFDNLPPGMDLEISVPSRDFDNPPPGMDLEISVPSGCWLGMKQRRGYMSKRFPETVVEEDSYWIVVLFWKVRSSRDGSSRDGTSRDGSSRERST